MFTCLILREIKERDRFAIGCHTWELFLDSRSCISWSKAGEWSFSGSGIESVPRRSNDPTKHTVYKTTDKKTKDEIQVIVQAGGGLTGNNWQHDTLCGNYIHIHIIHEFCFDWIPFCPSNGIWSWTRQPIESSSSGRRRKKKKHFLCCHEIEWTQILCVHITTSDKCVGKIFICKQITKRTKWKGRNGLEWSSTRSRQWRPVHLVFWGLKHHSKRHFLLSFISFFPPPSSKMRHTVSIL